MAGEKLCPVGQLDASAHILQLPNRTNGQIVVINVQGDIKIVLAGHINHDLRLDDGPVRNALVDVDINEDTLDLAPLMAVNKKVLVMPFLIPGALVFGQGNKGRPLEISEFVAKSLYGAALAVFQFIEASDIEIDADFPDLFEPAPQNTGLLDHDVIPRCSDQNTFKTAHRGRNGDALAGMTQEFTILGMIAGHTVAGGA